MNKDKKRDPEMPQTRKDNQRYFGIKVQVSVYSQSKMIHSVAATADSEVLGVLLHGEEPCVWGDSAYVG